MKDYICTRCGNFKGEGCGMPDYRVPVPYETGIRMERAACPLVLVERRETICERVSGFIYTLIEWLKRPN